MDPPTNGKVIISTNYGDLEVELWGKEAPKATRNFIQLSMEGFYDESLFHRLVSNFILQGGKGREKDESIYGKTFGKEPHTRLSFNKRGLLGMVNVGDDEKNPQFLCQFFITLNAETAVELPKSSTVFGKIVGETIYNLARISQLETKDEVPVHPIKIISIKVIVNPFDDIQPRLRQVVKEIEKEKPFKPKLSFQMSDDDDEPVEKIKSLHDVATNPMISQETPSLSKKSSNVVTYKFVESNEKITNVNDNNKDNDIDIDKQIESIKKELCSSIPLNVEEPPKKFNDQIFKYKVSKKTIIGKRVRREEDEIGILLELEKFRNKISSSPIVNVDDDDGKGKKKILEICKLHGLVDCKSCRETFSIGPDFDNLREEEKGWLMHRLEFDKEEGYREIKNDLLNLVVIDPREKAKELLKNKK